LGARLGQLRRTRRRKEHGRRRAPAICATPTPHHRLPAIRILLAALLLAATPLKAAEIGPCGEIDRIGFLVGQTKSFAQGKIKIAEVDTDGEPVCCSAHLLIFVPAPDIGSRCFALSDTAAKGESSARGFSGIAFSRIAGVYDAGKGLLLTVPYTLYSGGGAGHPRTLRVRVNLRGEGAVTIEK
jgi:hypothetical protein